MKAKMEIEEREKREMRDKVLDGIRNRIVNTPNKKRESGRRREDGSHSMMVQMREHRGE